MELRKSVLVFIVILIVLAIGYAFLSNLGNNRPITNNPVFNNSASSNPSNITPTIRNSNIVDPLIDCSVKSKSKKKCDFVAAYEATKNPKDSTEKQLKIQDAWMEICKDPCFNYDVWKIQNGMLD